MNANDELRAMLDECGVNWDYGITGAATTKFRANGVDLTFMPMRDGLVCTTILTPAQAIAATLGSEDTYTREDVEGAFVSGYSLGLDMFDSSKPDNEKGWNQNERNLDEEMEDLGWVRKDAATLSAGTCHEVEDEDTGFIVCSECGAVHDTDYTNYYCWCCGRKVVDE